MIQRRSWCIWVWELCKTSRVEWWSFFSSCQHSLSTIGEFISSWNHLSKTALIWLTVRRPYRLQSQGKYTTPRSDLLLRSQVLRFSKIRTLLREAYYRPRDCFQLKLSRTLGIWWLNWILTHAEAHQWSILKPLRCRMHWDFWGQGRTAEINKDRGSWVENVPRYFILFYIT